MVSADFYWLAHHDVTGKPRLHDRAVQMGCAAALLIDLIGGCHLEVSGGVLKETAQPEPAPAVLQRALRQVLCESQHNRRHGVAVWLDYLSRQAPTRIAEHLADAGHLERRTRRSMLVGPTATVYVPVDTNRAATPWALLVSRLRRGDMLGGEWLYLAGLVVASGLESFVLDGAPASTHEHLRQQVAAVPHQIREVLRHTHAAVGRAVLSHRT